MHDLVTAALARAFVGEGAWQVRDRRAFEALCSAGRGRIDGCLGQETALARRCLEAHHAIRTALGGDWPQAWQANLDDAREQLGWLVHQGFYGHTPAPRREQIPRYLEALSLRLAKLRRGGARDSEKLARIRPPWERFLARARSHRQQGRRDPALERYRWLLEEFRISLFAQEMGAAERVSRPRLDRLWASVPP